MKNQIEYFEKNKKKLYDLLIHCRDIPYYRDHAEFGYRVPEYNDFTYEYFSQVVPILEKETVRNHSIQFLDPSIPEEHLSLDSTSGTEGKPIICYRSRKERFYCSKSLWRMRRRFVCDICPTDKFARFYAFRNRDDQVVSNQIMYKDHDILLPLFDLSDDKLIEYWNAIVKFAPRWMHGPSSTIFCLALAVEKYNLPRYKFDFIELSGEFVQPEHKEYIEKVFQTKTTSQYGCREYWPMAYSHIDGRLMVITENIFIEQLYNEEHQKNELLITLLKNDTWPLIRYRIGDLGSYVFDEDGLTLTLHRGRKAEFFTLADERRFNAIIFSGLARAICELYDSNVILQFQIIKKSAYELSVLLRLHDECEQEKVMAHYKNEIQKIVGDDIDVNVQKVEYIKPDDKTGKTKEFINLC